MIVGTVPYMSPEQIEGQIVDHRTDIFSLGVLLYEMATGQRPFRGESGPALMSSILRDVPLSVLEMRDDLPRHLGRVISRCLEKDRRDRYQTARDVFNELKALRRETSSSRPSRSPVAPSPQTVPRPASSSEIRRIDVPWIAVLPLGCPTGDSEIERFADGLEEDIATGLSRFSYLFVVARKSTRRYRGEATDVRLVGEELGARYVMEGSVRRAGSRIRLGMNLIDASTGTHLWSETYDRDLEEADVFDLQDELTDRVVATVADPHGALTRSMAMETDSKPPESLTSHEAVLRLFLYRQRVSAEDHLVTRTALEHAAERDPNNAEILAALAGLCIEEANHDFNPRPDPLDRALAIARRAVEADPSSQLAHFYLAQAYFHSQNLSGFRAAANRALELNRRSTDTMAMLGILFGYAGDFETGIDLAGRAMELNPLHPGWYRFSPFMYAYLQGRDAEALEIAQQINMPEYWGDPLARTLAHAQLGNRTAAEAAARDLLRVWPSFEKDYKRVGLDPWVYAVPDLEARIVDGLRKAGLQIQSGSNGRSDPPVAARGVVPKSGVVRADEGFWVAVLPFKHRGTDPGLEALAEGLTEEIVAGLSRFSYLRVVTRSSSSQFAGDAVDVRQIGKALGAAYVLEGSLRQAGSVLRVAVLLVDASTGAHLWSETFDRDLSGLNTFQAQDQIADRVVSTVADPYGVLARCMAAPTQSKRPEDLTPYEAVLRFFLYQQRVSPEDHRIVRTALEHAVQLAPGSADAWAALAVIRLDEYRHDFDPRPGALDRALEAANRAVDADPSNQLAYSSLAQIHFFRGETGAFRAAADRALALNRRDGNTLADLGLRFGDTGDWARCLELTRAAMSLNPHHPGWYRYGEFLDHYRRGEYGEALAVAQRINMPSYYVGPLALAVSHAQLGTTGAARTSLRDLLQLQPDFARNGEAILGKRLYTQPELVAHLMDGLRKAGLKVHGSEPRPVGIKKDEGAVTIAVLPFNDMSPDKDQDYFCEGMAEEIMNALVHVDGIRVASRTSTFKAVEEGRDLKAIGRSLTVDQVLEGSVRMAGSRLRVTAQLTEVESGYQLWSERYDREAVDVFAIQDEIAAGVVEAVTSRLDSGVQTVPSREKVANVEAYRIYLKGRHFRYSKNDHAMALKSFDEAVAIDPGHAPSWIGKAEVTTLAAVYSLIPAREAYQTAKDALATASRLQDESAEGSYVEGMIAFCETRWKDSEAALRRSIELQPTFVQAHCWLGFLHSAHQRRFEAETAFAAACEIDPLAPYPYAMTACGQLTLGGPRQAVEPADQAKTFERENTLALYCSGMAKVATGGIDEGVEELEAAVRLSRRGGFILGIYGWGLAVAGRRDEAEAVLEELRSRPKPAPTAVSEAWILAALGDMDGAWQVLDRAEEELQPILSFAGMAPFDPLRSDPRFGALLERLGLPAGPVEGGQ